MKLGAVLSSVALPALCAGAANAQVSIPLPQQGPKRPPQTQTPIAPEPTPAPAPSQSPWPSQDSIAPGIPQLPIGVHGRPDINPYERDIDMTVPLNFQARSLGDIPMRLTADDRFLLETDAFLKLMRPIVNAEAHAALAAQLQGKKDFGPEDLGKNGVQLTYDPSTLAVVVVDVGAEQRAVEDLFAPPRDDINDVNVEPAGFSAFLNLNLNQVYIWEQDRVDPPTINFDGAVRVGRIVLEGDAQLGQRFGGEGDPYVFSRNYARLIYDEAEDYRRWIVGDLDPETRGQQSYVQMGGLGVLRQKRRFNAFRSAILQSNRQLVVQRESTVRFLRNGSLYREIRLQPGRYDFSSLPLIAGSNDVDVEIRDNSGNVQSLSYQQYLDPIDLDPGDYEFGAYLGATSRSFGMAPDYRGPVAFTGFFRKAFLNRPAIGVGFQISEDVQTLTGQTQFVLGNGGRILLDGAASNSKAVGQGFALGGSYEHFIDRGGLADNFSIRADYVSGDYATLGNPEASNTTSIILSGQYTRQFNLKMLATATASYVKGRGNTGDSYRIGVVGNYRMSPKWTLRAGVDYARFSSNFSSGNGVSFNIGLIFQPDYRRRAEARFESRDNLGELSYNQSGLNQLDSLGFGGVIARQDGNARAQGFAAYSANRFEAAVSHGSFGPGLSNIGDINATSVRLGTTLAFADGAFGIGRRINDSFMLLQPHKNLGDRSVVAGQSIAENNYIGRSGPLGAAVNNFLGSYVTQSVQYDVEDPPTGYDIGPGVVRVHPPYKSGYKLRIGTDAFVSAVGTLIRSADKPVSLIGGRVTLLDVKTGENPQPVPFFTNSVGRFSIANLLPGRKYLVETYSHSGTIDRAFEFSVPAESDGLLNLGTVLAGAKN